MTEESLNDCTVWIGAVGSTKISAISGRNTYSYVCLEPRLAVAGKRAGWGGWQDERCLDATGRVMAGARGERPRRIEVLDTECGGSGEQLIGVAGDGSTLVYAKVVTEQIVPPDCLSESAPCRYQVISGAVYEITPGAIRRLSNAPRPAAIAVSGRFVAILEADPLEHRDPFVHSSASGLVEIHDLKRQKSPVRFTATRPVAAIALSESIVSVLVRGPVPRLELRGASTGSLVHAISVPRTTARDIAISGSTVVYRTGRTIRFVDAQTRKSGVLTVARAVPRGLSVEASRVAWIENIRGRGYVRAITLG